MKRFAAIIAILVIFAVPDSARAQVLPSYSGVQSYFCAANMGGFNLARQGNVYRLTGPLYVPLPGYTYAISNVRINPFMPEGEATLTLIAPRNILNQSLSPLAVVAPLWIDYSFISAVPVQKLTIFISNPINRFDTQITCL